MLRMRRFVTHPILMLVLALLFCFGLATLPIQRFYEVRPEGQFTYPLDDTYIHMAMAKNLAQHGVLGATPDGFTASTSSILWPLLLALVYFVFGVSDLAPLFMNIVFAALAIFFAWRILRRLVKDNPAFLFAGLVAMVYVTPLPSLLILGMETTLQISACLAFADVSLLVLSRRGQAVERKTRDWLLLVGVIFASVRYEDLALVALVCFLLLLQRRVKLAFLLGGLALIPTILFGLVSVWEGWHFLPNSVILKSFNRANHLQTPWQTLLARFVTLSQESYLLYLWGFAVLGTLGFLVERVRRYAHPEALWLLLMLPPMVLTQALFGQLGWFYRYEAYIIALGVVAVSGLIGGWLVRMPWRASERASLAAWRSWALRVPLAVAACWYMFTPLYSRGVLVLRDTHLAMTNIYDQQIHMARFIRAYYSGSCVIINDLGAVSYMGNVSIIDLPGLATKETADASLQGKPLRPLIEELSRERNVRLAVVYDTWYPNQLPTTWKAVGFWTLDQRFIAGGETVTFYATFPEEVDYLRQSLKEFVPSLPPAERWEIR
jgi:hypothetical protein